MTEPIDLSQFPSLQRLVDTNPAYRAAWKAGKFPPKIAPGVASSRTAWTTGDPSRGLGDTIAKITNATGIDKAADWAAKKLGMKDCGCHGEGGRQGMLNRLVPYPAPAIDKRHLIYHVYPDTRNDVWRLNIQELLKRWDLFTGRKIIAIALGPATHDVGEVLMEFGREDFDWFTRPNDPRLREVATFGELLSRVHTTAPDAVFYAHTKGNSNTEHPQEPIAAWRDGMYAKLLDGWSEVEKALGRATAVGTHMMQWHVRDRSPFPTQMQPKYRWIFAGTFFWFRADRIFSLPNWSHVPNDRYGAEGWLAGLIPSSESASLWQPWTGAGRLHNPYDPALYGVRNAKA